MIRGVIFDYDGVICDSFVQSANANRAVMRHFGLKFSLTLFREHHVDWREFYRMSGVQEKLIESIPSIWNAEMKKQEHAKYYTGIPIAIRELARSRKLAIVSNNLESRICDDLKRNRLLGVFGAIIGYETGAGRLKPDPASVKMAMKKLKIKPSETCLIGDTHQDIETAKRAGIRCIAVTYGYQPRRMLDGADTYARSPNELAGIVEDLG